jgi:serine protease Do/serine protease DegQ
MKVVEIERGSPLYQRIQGLIVTAVEQGSRAGQAGFRPGDIIYAVSGKRVRTLAEFQAALRGAERGFAVSLLRGDFNVTLLIR